MAGPRNAQSRASLKKMRDAWLKRWPKQTRDNLQSAAEQGAGIVAQTAVGFAPHKTGALQESIRVVLPGDVKPGKNVRALGAIPAPGAIAAAVVAGDKTAWYAALVEFGTKFAMAHPYFWPAWRLRKKEVRKVMSRAFKEAVKGRGIPRPARRKGR